MEVIGIYTNNGKYEIVFTGNQRNILVEGNYNFLEAASLSSETLDYDNKACIIEFENSIYIETKEDFVFLNSFKISLLNKKNKNLLVEYADKKININVKS